MAWPRNACNEVYLNRHTTKGASPYKQQVLYEVIAVQQIQHDGTSVQQVQLSCICPKRVQHRSMSVAPVCSFYRGCKDNGGLPL